MHQLSGSAGNVRLAFVGLPLLGADRFLLAQAGDSGIWIDAGLFALLAGGALFAICRGSGRV